jgi:hypothetical protein
MHSQFAANLISTDIKKTACDGDHENSSSTFHVDPRDAYAAWSPTRRSAFRSGYGRRRRGTIRRSMDEYIVICLSRTLSLTLICRPAS